MSTWRAVVRRSRAVVRRSRAFIRRRLARARGTLVTLVRRLIRRFALTLLKARSSPRGAVEAPDRPATIRILLLNAYAMGGTTRTVLNQAGYLARANDVEIISLLRKRKQPFFPFPPGVRVTVLDDRVDPPGRLGRLLSRLPSLLTPEADRSFGSLSLWTDLRLARRIRRERSGVLMATRPSLNLLVAELAGPGVVTIGQDHMNLGSYRDPIRREIGRRYGGLTALTVLTSAASTEYREALAGRPVRIVRIPNALPAMDGGMSQHDPKVMIAAGRLTPQKGFDLLIQAFTEVAAKHPEWVLRIFGSGRLEAKLTKMIAEHRLTENVVLKPSTRRLGHELAGASVYVLSSRFEGMPMVVIEAMSKGLAVVGFDCPHGPADLITHLSDGLLVPPKDVAELSAALLHVIEDEELRRRLGRQAEESARAYDLEVVGALWDGLLAELRR
jgi:glycosyltransferase involved in cell wall biosynthesis